MNANKNPEQIARDKIDQMLMACGWHVQSRNKIDWSAGRGIAVREYPTDIGPADYVLFVDRKAVGVIEAKREEEGLRLSVVEEQSGDYAKAKLKHINNEPLPFVYESTGIVTRFTDNRDPKPRGRNIFSFPKPETIGGWVKDKESLRSRLQNLPALDTTGLRPAQIVAINNLENSFKNNRPRALIQMATGAGKTFTAATFIYRLLRFAHAKRILFLVDTKNLGEQAEQEFMTFQLPDVNRKFTEYYNVQRLTSGYIAPDSHVCISTIQRLYSILKGEEISEEAELDSPENNTWLQSQFSKKQPAPVEYSAKIPIEHFDFIVIDECHRSIYNLWKQVLEYFDAFLIGLTATPDKRTFGFFNENVVSQYTYEESVIDGVNVPYTIYTIDTEISRSGGVIHSDWYIERRDKLTRAKRWQQEDEDVSYSGNDLDKKVVNISQIRNIIREFKRVLREKIYPERIDENGDYEVPKTLIFAKTDSHADDIIRIVREEFDEGNDFCKKVTYKNEEDPKSVLNRFRTSYYPRIAVTVDMIATGTDVKPLEVLLFMRDVRSTNYFEQMKGRGVRTVDKEALQAVSRTAPGKTHFVIVDAVGAVRSKKTDSRSLERKPTVALKDLLEAVLMKKQDEDLFLSLANRLIRVERQITEKEKRKIVEYSGGKSLKQIARELLAAYDPDEIEQRAQEKLSIIAPADLTADDEDRARTEAQQELIGIANSTFTGELNEYIEKVRRQHEQLIDHINLDTITRSEWDTNSVDQAQEIVKDFTEYLLQHKDEITALSIYYNQPYNRRHITFSMIREVMDRLRADKPQLAPVFVWDAYAAIEEVKNRKPQNELTLLVSLIRRACGIDSELQAYDGVIHENFKNWFFRQNEGQHNRFTPEQRDWLRMIRDHIVSSYHIELDDLDYTPFDAQGGRGKMYQLFGDEMNNIINELNEALTA